MYIEREALLAELSKGTIITDDLYGMGIMAGVDAAMKKVAEQPAADVAPVVHGRWDLYGTHYCCSKCLVALRDKVPYCPNCGARMDGERGDT